MAKGKRVGLADQLRRAIERSAVTMYRLSQESGVDRSQLSRFMSRKRDLSLEATDKLCRVLGLRFCAERDGVLVPAEEARPVAMLSHEGRPGKARKPKAGMTGG